MKNMKLDAYAKAYILNCIDGSGYDRDLTTDYGRLKFLVETFDSEYQWHIKQVGPQKAFSEWLTGLPSACTVEYRNFEIIQIAKQWGSIPEDASEAQEQKILDNWFSFLANKALQMFKKYKVAA
jgi:hypothetical protein